MDINPGLYKVGPTTERGTGYYPPGSGNVDALRWLLQGGNATEWYRPLRPGEKSNLQDDEGAQSLQDAMRLRMRLPR